MGKKYKYEDNHKTIDGIEYKLCNRHHEYFENEDPWLVLNNENFYYNKTSPDTFNTWCKRCAVKKSHIRNMENYDDLKQCFKNAYYRDKTVQKEKARMQRINGYQKQYQQNNPDKLRKYAEKHRNKRHKISKKEWTKCKEYFNNECAYCGLRLDEHYIKFNGEIRLGDFHKEHVQHDGEQTISNCVPSCKTCNVRKHKDSLDVWYSESNENFSKQRLEKIYQWINIDSKK